MIVPHKIETPVLCFHLYVRITIAPETSDGTKLFILSKFTSFIQYTTSIAIAHIGRTLPRYMTKEGVLFLNMIKGRNLMAMVVRDMTITISQLYIIVTLYDTNVPCRT